MKKLMILLAVASCALFANAQSTVVAEEVPTVEKSVATNKFGSNWWISLNGGANIFNGVVTNGESPFEHLGFVGTLAAGKWHSPGFGWRIAVEAGQWKPFEESNEQFFMNPHFDAMFNLSNLFCGYREGRIWNVIPYVGVGWAGANYEGVDGIHGSITANYGILNTFRVAKHWAINLDLSGKFLRNGFSGVAGSQGHDMMWGAQVGVTYKFNNVGWDATVDAAALMAMNAAALAELNAQLAAKNKENNQLKGQLADAQKALAECRKHVCKPAVVANQSVFFAFDSANIESKKEILNLKALAEAAIEAGAKLNVTGYADKIGNAEYNQKLSQRRADAVKAQLVEMGVPAENINAVGAGVSETESPTRLNRRVVVSVAK